MTSSTYKDGIEYSGFSQSNRDIWYSIGKGINEGYTQLLTERYFPYTNIVGRSYKYEVEIARCLECKYVNDVQQTFKKKISFK